MCQNINFKFFVDICILKSPKSKRMVFRKMSVVCDPNPKWEDQNLVCGQRTHVHGTNEASII